jgi:hypothetical protein
LEVAEGIIEGGGVFGGGFKEEADHVYTDVATGGS